MWGWRCRSPLKARRQSRLGMPPGLISRVPRAFPYAARGRRGWNPRERPPLDVASGRYGRRCPADKTATHRRERRVGRRAPRGPTVRRRERDRTSTPLSRHRLLRPARLPFRHSPAAKSSASREATLAVRGPMRPRSLCRRTAATASSAGGVEAPWVLARISASRAWKPSLSVRNSQLPVALAADSRRGRATVSRSRVRIRERSRCACAA